MKASIRLIFSIATIMAVSGLAASKVFAQAATSDVASTPATLTKWQKDHPRRVEVNGRLKHQNKRITNEVKAGEITPAEAKNLRANDKAIHGEEKAMATQNGGHITKVEKKALNQQLNQNSHAIGK